MADIDDISVLQEPLPVPSPLGEAPSGPVYRGGFSEQTQAMAGGLTGAIKDANLAQLPLPGKSTYPGPMFEPTKSKDFDKSDISNVGGATGLAKKDFKTIIPEKIKEEEVEPVAEEKGLGGEVVDVLESAWSGIKSIF